MYITPMSYGNLEKQFEELNYQGRDVNTTRFRKELTLFLVNLEVAELIGLIETRRGLPEINQISSFGTMGIRRLLKEIKERYFPFDISFNCEKSDSSNSITLEDPFQKQAALFRLAYL